MSEKLKKKIIIQQKAAKNNNKQIIIINNTKDPENFYTSIIFLFYICIIRSHEPFLLESTSSHETSSLSPKAVSDIKTAKWADRD